MRLLLDTHILIWTAIKPEKLSQRATQLLLDDSNELYLSYASIWEMQIKLGLGKLDLKVPLPTLIEAQQKTNNLQLLTISLSHLYKINDLSSHHKDPFDRLIIAQSLSEEMPVISTDTAFDGYSIERLW